MRSFYSVLHCFSAAPVARESTHRRRFSKPPMAPSAAEPGTQLESNLQRAFKLSKERCELFGFAQLRAQSRRQPLKAGFAQGLMAPYTEQLIMGAAIMSARFFA